MTQATPDHQARADTRHRAIITGRTATLIGFGLAFWLSAIGGVILTIGAIVSLVAVFFGTPVSPE